HQSFTGCARAGEEVEHDVSVARTELDDLADHPRRLRKIKFHLAHDITNGLLAQVVVERWVDPERLRKGPSDLTVGSEEVVTTEYPVAVTYRPRVDDVHPLPKPLRRPRPAALPALGITR